jgi:protein-tyrosine phosphatase
MDVDDDSTHDSAYVSADSKRSSSTSLNAPPVTLNPPSFLNMGRHESPAQAGSPFATPGGRSQLAKTDERHPRLSMTHDRPDPPSPGKKHSQRADTVPMKQDEGGPAMMSPSQLEDLLEHTPASEILLLDLRVSPQYAQSRIKGALNLCIPTTLLKRATFNLQKLQTTFHGEQEQGKFANWQNTSYLVVYDAFSSDKRDALSAMNMIKKFVNEGYSGSMSILRGGFNAFAATYPELVDRNSSASSATGLTLGAGGATKDGRPTIAPVIGGVMLPGGSNNPNPFFSNIRQNQDLVDGVGQMRLGLPAQMTPESLPRWLKEAADPADQGKKVSDKFLRIELTEQSRMRDAYSAFKPSGAGDNAADESRVQLSGIEKGVKNRYKDILPFEHARVRLEGRPEGTCDYVNASHIKSTRSHKRYIASQGPLPATFEVRLPPHTYLF